MVEYAYEIDSKQKETKQFKNIISGQTVRVLECIRMCLSFYTKYLSRKNG